MKKTLGLAIAGTLLGAATVSAQTYGYLANAVNDINDIYYQAAPLSAEDRLRIANIACGALTQLADDTKFQSNTQTLYSQTLPENRDEVSDILNNVARLSEFVEIESAALQSEGINPAAQRAIGSAAAQAAPDAASLVGDLNADNVSNYIEEIRSAACRFQSDAQGAYRTAMLRYGFFGVVLIGVDGLNIGLLGPLAGASAVIGGNMVLEAVDGLR